jgi:hypothetical protein
VDGSGVVKFATRYPLEWDENQWIATCHLNENIRHEGLVSIHKELYQVCNDMMGT